MADRDVLIACGQRLMLNKISRTEGSSSRALALISPSTGRQDEARRPKPMNVNMGSCNVGDHGRTVGGPRCAKQCKNGQYPADPAAHTHQAPVLDVENKRVGRASCFSGINLGTEATWRRDQEKATPRMSHQYKGDKPMAEQRDGEQGGGLRSASLNPGT